MRDPKIMQFSLLSLCKSNIKFIFSKILRYSIVCNGIILLNIEYCYCGIHDCTIFRMLGKMLPVFQMALISV